MKHYFVRQRKDINFRIRPVTGPTDRRAFELRQDASFDLGGCRIIDLHAVLEKPGTTLQLDQLC
jgi:hypothetical protein